MHGRSVWQGSWYQAQLTLTLLAVCCVVGLVSTSWPVGLMLLTLALSWSRADEEECMPWGARSLRLLP